MTQWYYAQGAQRQGPLAAETLVDLFQRQAIGLDTLVWREGQGAWQPLGNFAAELGLMDTAAVPPPLPSPAAPQYPSGPVSAPPKRGLSGCMIAVIVMAVLAVPLVGILAAIALPAYQQYTVRAKVAGATRVAEPLKQAVADYQHQHQACPDNDQPGFGSPETYAAGNVASATVGTFESEHCGIELRLSFPANGQLDGKALWFEYDPTDRSWQCSSEVDDKYLPVNCRG